MLLLASIGVTAVAVVQAQRTLRSQQALAESALREYASFAAWSYQQHLRETLRRALSEALGAVHHGDAMHTSPRVPDAGELAQYLPFDKRCQCHRAYFGPLPRNFFGYQLGTDTLGIGVNRYPRPDSGWTADSPFPHGVNEHRGGGATATYSGADQLWINRTVSAHLRSGSSERGWGFLVPRNQGQPRVLAYVVMPTSWGDTLVYGMEYRTVDFATMLADVLDNRGLLPASFTRAHANREVIEVEVTTAESAVLFRAKDSPGWQLAAENSLPQSLGELRVRARIRPEVAGSLIIGGLPRSRLPFLLGLLGLSAALALVAVGQLRREHELAQLRSDFVAAVSHELRTPLTQIRLFLETLRLGRARTEEERAWTLANIERETVRLAFLVDNVLLFSRAGHSGPPGPRHSTDVAGELRTLVEEFRPLAASRRAHVELRAVPVPPVALADGALRHIVLNLLDNAVKYGPPGQTVRVQAGARPDGWVRLVVSDEGHGVAAAERETVWQPFHRGTAAARTAAAGSGIGLGIVRDTVCRHGGRAWIEDAPGAGAAFVVELPAESGCVP